MALGASNTTCLAGTSAPGVRSNVTHLVSGALAAPPGLCKARPNGRRTETRASYVQRSRDGGKEVTVTYRIYRAAFAAASLVLLLETAGAPKKW